MRKTIIYFLFLSIFLFLSWCSSDNKIESKLLEFWEKQKIDCKENIKFYFSEVFLRDKYCKNKTELCNNLIEVENIMRDNCDKIEEDINQLSYDLLYSNNY